MSTQALTIMDAEMDTGDSVQTEVTCLEDVLRRQHHKNILQDPEKASILSGDIQDAVPILVTEFEKVMGSISDICDSLHSFTMEDDPECIFDEIQDIGNIERLDRVHRALASATALLQWLDNSAKVLNIADVSKVPTFNDWDSRQKYFSLVARSRFPKP